VFNVYYHHYRVARAREPKRWYFSIWVIILLTFLLLYGFVIGGAYTPQYQWFWFHLSAWAYTSTLTVQGLFQISAGYRAFRARSLEASILLISAFITVLGYAPLSGTAFPVLSEIAVWMTRNPSAAANRGITIGTGVGALAVSFRILLGRERNIAGVE
jgi:cation transport ATPase